MNRASDRAAVAVLHRGHNPRLTRETPVAGTGNNRIGSTNTSDLLADCPEFYIIKSRKRPAKAIRKLNLYIKDIPAANTSDGSLRRSADRPAPAGFPLL
jgi:hypothetical protein